MGNSLGGGSLIPRLISPRLSAYGLCRKTSNKLEERRSRSAIV
jgi:hypothetical protein